MENTEILDQELTPQLERRRNLLPLWVKIFLWIFMVFGAVAPISLVLGVLGIDFDLSMYGLQTSKPLSVIGTIIILFFSIKGIVSFGLWTEKNWAINLAIIDAIIGIVACVLVMILLPLIFKNSGFNFTFRGELIALIPYLMKMRKIKPDWEIRKYERLKNIPKTVTY